MKRTAFYDIHVRLGGKIVPFAGYEMPVQYAGIIEEHRCVRNAVGIFDVSHMGEFEIRGRDALALVQKVTTNDASKLPAGKAQYSAMCYADGGIVDDLLVYNMGDYFMLVVNAANIDKDFEWIRSNIGSLNAKLENKSDAYSLLAVQGPASLNMLQKLTPVDLAAIQYYGFTKDNLSGVPMIISRTGYTGERGFELYFDSSVATGERVWSVLMDAGKEFGVMPIGLGARDTLRLEMGFCLYGNDIDKTTTPLEAGLGWITKLDKGSFNGREVLIRTKQEGIRRKLVGFALEDEKAFPRHGYEIRRGGQPIGSVTSGTVSPVLDRGIGLGYVPTELAAPGTDIAVAIRNKEARGRVVNIPFIKK